MIEGYPDRARSARRYVMSSRKKSQKPKRLFSRKNQARRAPPILHSEKQDFEPIYIDEFEGLEDSGEFEDLEDFDAVIGLDGLEAGVLREFGRIAPPAPPGTDPKDVNEFGMLKMSVVLEEFADPFLDEHMDDKDLASFFRLASLAWNLALHPEVDVQKKVWGLLRPEAKRESLEEAQKLVGLVETLIQRKHDFFESDKRTIIDVETVPQRGQRFFLTVVTGLG
jgi:hypothetical protein